VTRRFRPLCATLPALVALLWIACAAHGADAGADGAAMHAVCGTGSECAELAKRHRTGNGAPKDPQVASDLYRMACDQGHALSCSDLADMLAIGGDIRRDEKRALELFVRGCTLGFGNACFSAGNMHMQGSREPGVIRKDNVRAAALFKEGCDGGEGVACDVLAEFYSRGKGVRKNKALAKQLRKRAAELGFERE
jgi:uncharacterized protein